MKVRVLIPIAIFSAPLLIPATVTVTGPAAGDVEVGAETVTVCGVTTGGV
jgi:hypothetical protein